MINDLVATLSKSCVDKTAAYLLTMSAKRLTFDAAVLYVTNLEAISHHGQYFKMALYLQLHADLDHSLASHYVSLRSESNIFMSSFRDRRPPR
jgi:hypothetical protein